ncbi:hypothetical protein B0T14DRAFT_223135 [Immersiella caudata]|uniref:Uncharacterized protein n=1 Tax=Immersiella caudata TaxID=314043 RepID=A0AA40C0E7_9PEZI|nr:hypothetical protein B0T14DRAFT_223135 [Immersiella caudata]
MDTTAELDRLTDSLTRTISELRGLCDDTQKENAELMKAVTSIADGLASIQSSVEGIRHLLAGLYIKSEADDDEATLSAIVARCGPRLRTVSNVSGAVIERLDIVVVLSPEEDEWGYESDWTSISDSVKDVKSTIGNQLGERDDILKRVGGVMEPLCGAWGIILDALEASQPGFSNQPDPLESSASRDVFRRLEKRSCLLSADNEARRLPWDTLFKPFRLKGLLGRVNSHGEPQPSNDRPSLSRTKTWPMLLKPVDPEVEEARNRSARIDKQIKADSFVHRNTCSVVLQNLLVSRESKLLLADSFAALSSASGAERKLDSSTISAIRKRLHLEAEHMARLAQQIQYPSDEESVYLDALEKKMQDGKLQVLDQDVAFLIRSLWSLEACRRESLQRGRPQAFDKIIIDALLRAVGDHYLPTPADHRRFGKPGWQHGNSILGTFSFSFDPVSITLLDPSHLFKFTKLYKLTEEITSLVWTIDLANYDQATLPEETDKDKYFDHTLMLMSCHGKPNSPFRRYPGRSSLILILHHVKEFKSKLKQIPFSAIYPDFVGQNTPREVIRYMMKKILAEFGDKTRVYPHVGELSSRSTVRFILAAVKETMLHRALVDSGMF